MFRITDKIPEGFLPGLRRSNELLLVVREFGKEGDNLHYHGLCNARINSLRTFFKRNLEGGNKRWSVKKTDGNAESCFRYLCKGADEDTPPDIVFSTVDHDKYHQEYYECREEYVSELRKKRRKLNVLEDCWTDIKDKISTDEIDIGAAICEWYGEQGKRFPARFAMQTMVTTYLWRKESEIQTSDKMSSRDFYLRYYKT